MSLRSILAAGMLAATLASTAAQVGNAQARGATGSTRPADTGQPIEIVARDGIEWDRENMRYVARGAARVTQDDKTIEADTLTAHYREGPGGGTEIYRYTAAGNVRIASASQRAVADNGVYDVDGGVVTLTGSAMKITTASHEITARDSLEYWERKEMAVARGDALVVTGDGRRISADMLAAYFTQAPPPGAARSASAARRQPAPSAAGVPTPAGDRRLDRVEAVGKAIVTTATEIAQGDKGQYNATTGIATMTGNVKLTRGRSQAAGDVLELNLNTGLYKLSCKPGAGSTCVRGLFVPERRGDARPAP
jgi:lipopolysaccharide export system protein LptA